MVENLIAGYLATGKRLVIPDLGAFLKKESGETVFVEFLKKDDGVLAGLVAQSMGVPQLEAASIVLQFSADVKMSLGSKGFYVVPRVGTLRRDGTGAIALSAGTMDEGRQEAPARDAVVPPQPQVTAASPASTAQVPKPTAPALTVTPPVGSGQHQPPRPQPAVQSQPAAAPAQRAAEPVTRPIVERPAVTHEQTVRRPANHSHSPGPQLNPPRKRTDMIMIIAIAAALIAIGSMVFGLLVESNPIKNIQPVREQVVAAPTGDELPAAEEEAPAE
ncbi:MAG: hypothetical protein LUF87_05465 [Alistipes sp.]|nr:hypothetical protein [Alistipes sp.]